MALRHFVWKLNFDYHFKSTSEMEALINFEEIPLKNIHCSSGGKNFSYLETLSFRPSLEILGNSSKF